MTTQGPTLEYCSLAYLNLWLVNDSVYHKALQPVGDDTIHAKSETLIKAGKFYSVARGLPTEYDVEVGLVRYQPVIDIMDQLQTHDFGGGDSVQTVNPQCIDIINAVAEEIGKRYPTKKGNRRNVLSLTSKFLWLKFKSPVLIYDKNARVALSQLNGTKIKENDLSSFYGNWIQAYAESKEEIVSICSQLHHIHRYAVNEIDAEDVRSLASQPWFQERVFDIYLWGLGAPK